tara:strand:+ start:33048 stop:35840 length:2793 start_codon:yes stop_codon:yes gene_type:complete
LLSLLLTVSFTLNSYAKIKVTEKPVTIVEKKLNLLAVEVDNPIEVQRAENFFAPDPKTKTVNPPKSFLTAQERFIALKGKHNRIVEMVKAREGDKFIVPVSIIDSGIDPLNNFAESILDWKIQNGKVVGAGQDFLSNTPWAIPQLQDPWIYAIGADGIDEIFRVVGAKENPIEFLTKLNEDVMEAVVKAIKANPNLQNTFFTKINSSNTNMIGLLRLLGYHADEKVVAQFEKQGRLISPQTSPVKVNPEDASLLKFAATSWIMSSDAGLPDFLSLFELERLKGLKELQATVDKALSVGGETGLGASLKKLIGVQATYFKGHHFETNTPRKLVGAYTMAKLSEQIAFKKLGTQIYNPSNDFYLALRKMKAVYPGATWDQIIERAFNVYTGVLATMLQDPATQTNFAEINEIKGQLASLDLVRKFIYEGTKNKNFEVILKQIEEKGRAPWIPGESSLYRKFVMRTKLPDMHKEAEFHGTHVATTGEAYLNKGYVADGARVGLGAIGANVQVQQEMVIKNLELLNAWFQKPVVARAIFDTLKKDGITETAEGRANLPKSIDTQEDIQKLAKFMTQKFGPNLMSMASQRGMVGLELHLNLIERFKDDAMAKRPIGNLSLGGESSFPSRHATLDTPEEKLASKMDFIFNEFQKYMIAEGLATHGKNTLYFMAAGNSNNVGDGTTQSDFPADLRPKWLEKYKLPGEGPLPGEKVSNIAIVMSANEDGNRSGFSNMIFTENAQFMARGENINSGAMGYSLYMSNTMIKARYPEVFRAQRFMSGIDDSDSRVADAMERMQIPFEEFAMLRSLLIQTTDMVRSHKALQFNDQRAEISGTSMGSPEVAFFMAEKRREKMKKDNLTNEEAYGKAGYRPEDMIQLLATEAKLVPVGTVKNSVPSIFDKQKYVPRSEKANALEKDLNNIRSSNILCIRFYGGK